MIVVPTISESDESEEEVVVASVGRVVWTGAPQVAYRVDYEWHLKNDEMTEQAAPKETDQRVMRGSADQKAGEPGGS